MWDTTVSHSYYSLGEILHFITIICKSFAFLTPSDVGNDSVIYRQQNHSLPYFRNPQILSLFSFPVDAMGFSKCIDSEVLFMFGNSR